MNNIIIVFIIEYIDFILYDFETYQTSSGLGELSMGRWLGVYHKVGHLMSYFILTVSGRFISCVIVQRLTSSEVVTEQFQKQMQLYYEDIKNKFVTEGTDLIPQLSDVE